MLQRNKPAPSSTGATMVGEGAHEYGTIVEWWLAGESRRNHKSHRCYAVRNQVPTACDMAWLSIRSALILSSCGSLSRLPITCISHHSHSCYTSRSPHRLWLFHPKRRTKILNPLVIKICHSVTLVNSCTLSPNIHLSNLLSNTLSVGRLLWSRLWRHVVIEPFTDVPKQPAVNLIV
jgi:hypothetical protein